MNYHAPREQLDPATGQPSGRWCYTTMNDGRIWTHPCCADHRDEGHATPEEARECAARYRLAQSDLDAKFVHWTDCVVPGCDEPTKTGANVHGIGMSDTVALCPKHLTMENLAAILGDQAGDIASS